MTQSCYDVAQTEIWRKVTHDDERVCDACDDVELRLECKRQVAEDAAEQVDGHERDGDPDDLAIPVDFIVLGTGKELW